MMIFLIKMEKHPIILIKTGQGIRIPLTYGK